MLGATLVPTRADLLDMASKPTAPSSVNAPARGLGSGIHLGNLDPRVRPQDDFYGYVNGTWLQATEIPADKYEVSAFSMLDDALQEALRALVEDAARAAAQPRDADVRQIGDLFSGFMDETERERQELQPLSAELTRIESLENNAAIPALVAHFNRLGIRTVYDTRVGQDARDSTRYAVAVEQSGLGLPDRDYYLQDDARLAEIRSRYCEHMQKMFVLAGVASAAADAQAVLLLETRIAHAQWTKVANRDPVRTYNKVEVGALELLTPGFDWHSYLVAADLDGREQYVISQPELSCGGGQHRCVPPLVHWQPTSVTLLDAYAPFLPASYSELHFDFHQHTLSGVQQQRPRWKRAVATLDANIGEIVGKLYVARHFTPEAKQHMQQLVGQSAQGV
jgi:putative endopeptidase